MRVRAMVEFHVNEHNTKMPHPAFSGQTPDEMFFGTGAQVPEELVLAKGHARAVRMAANRFPIDSRADAVANTKFIMSSHAAGRDTKQARQLVADAPISEVH